MHGPLAAAGDLEGVLADGDGEVLGEMIDQKGLTGEPWQNVLAGLDDGGGGEQAACEDSDGGESLDPRALHIRISRCRDDYLFSAWRQRLIRLLTEWIRGWIR